MEKLRIFIIIIPIFVISMVLYLGFSYAHDVSNDMKSGIPNTVSCDHLKWKLDYFEDLNVLGIDKRGIIKELQIKNAMMGCGF